MKKSELLLPVGNMDMCLAAIHGGADAIYVGMPGFNARGRSSDLSIEALKEMIDLCHLYGVKVHIAFNILIFEDEIEHAINMLDEVIPLGPDALIVQDIGLCKIINKLYPEQVIHASTQMTVTNDQAIEFTSDLNIDRYVLGRENSIPEIKKIREKTDKELEVFVHGALCVAYSGQCFTSESIGGRSANRGQCAQSCRFSYELIVDDKVLNLIDKNYLVSPQDLCGINEVYELQTMGIESFKVEGRLKSPAFVGTAAKSYKSVLETGKVIQEDIDKMATAYSRGFYSGWLHGVDHQKLVHGKYQDHRGPLLGSVTQIKGKSITLKTTTEIKNGMGIVICNDQRKLELGSSVYESFKSAGATTLVLSKDFDMNKVEIGDEVYLSSNPEVAKEVEKSISDLSKQKRIGIKMVLNAIVGEKLELEVTDQDDNYVLIDGEDILEAAKKDYDQASIESELQSLSRTIYECHNIEINLSTPKPFLHSKALKKLRSEAVEKLNLKRIEVNEIERGDTPQRVKNLDSKKETKKLNILLRNISQVNDFIKYFENVKTNISLNVIIDFEFGKDYKEALDSLRSSKLSNSHFGIATNRILKPGEYHHLNVLGRLKPDFILARNLGAIEYLKKHFPDITLIGDFSLNAANSFTVNYLLNKGLESITSSYDLNQDQLMKLLDYSDASKVEVTIHQYMPSFHMEHCVFAAFLSKGSSFKDCGKPCEKHDVKLKDQFGNYHFIKADQECRNTMYNAKAQSAANILPNLLAKGVCLFRVELLSENSDNLKRKIESYINFLEEKISIEDLTCQIGEIEKFGLGSGQLLKDEKKQVVSLHHTHN